MSKRKRNLPPMERRPVFVMYTAVRRCRFNPSFERMLNLPAVFKDDVIDRWEGRHPRQSGQFLFDGSELSRPPKKKGVRR